MNKRTAVIIIAFTCLVFSFVASSFIVWVVYTSEEERGPFYGSSEGNTYHYPWCSYVNRTKPENLIKFSIALEADIRGYHPCDICDPPEPSNPHFIEIIVAGLIPAYIGLIIALVTLFVRDNRAFASSERPHKRQEIQNNKTQNLSSTMHIHFRIQKTITSILITAALLTLMITPIAAQGQYVGSKNGDVYHVPSCRYVQQIKPENLVWFASEQAAIGAVYRPCLVCIQTQTETQAPTPIPTALPTPTPTLMHSPTPSPIPTPTASPPSTPTLSPTPTGSPTPTPTQTITPTPSPIPTPTPTPTLTPTPSPTTAPTPTPTPIPEVSLIGSIVTIFAVSSVIVLAKKRQLSKN